VTAPPTTIGPLRPSELPEIRAMIGEYCRWIDIDLAFQEIDAELAGLPGEYAPPGGILLVARAGDRLVGVVAYRRLDARVCEMKRLFVGDEARGRGLARALVLSLLAHATEAGYAEIRLDTLPMMGAAQRLYESLGFHDIAPYYDTPIAGTRFMARALGGDITYNRGR
jgi:ribosomal protein S18 acetylase RimI-like enzyme